MPTTEQSERIAAALAQISDISDPAWIAAGLASAYTNDREARERVSESHHVSEGEISSLAIGVAQHEVASSLLRAIEMGRVLTCSQLRDYLIMQAGFMVPDNGGLHGLMSQHKTKYALDMLTRLLAVSPR